MNAPRFSAFYSSSSFSSSSSYHGCTKKTLEYCIISQVFLMMKDHSPSPHGLDCVSPHHTPLSPVIASPGSNSSIHLNNLSNCYYEQRLLSPPQQQNKRKAFSEHSELDGLPEERSNANIQLLLGSQGASTFNNIDEWKLKLIMLLRSKDRVELVSREKKDRRDFEQIADLASRMGLYSHVYAKVVVVSKLPLPNYRFDLDDKRPQREVVLSSGVQRRVEAHLERHISQLPKKKKSSWDVTFSKSGNNGNIATDDWLLGQVDVQLSKPFMEEILYQRSLQLYNQQRSWQESLDGKRIMGFRTNLPANKEKNTLLTAISQNQVVIVSGRTGCGKTTQIPQFILESQMELLRGALCNIICTQPRRISAVSVSERVAAERGENLGESVGYKVRLEGMKGSNTLLLFCTTGILLRRLLNDKNLIGVTHVIVDEIHERGMNEDFLLIVLKDLLPRRPELRLILMSATLDAELLSSYFGGVPIIQIPGFMYPVETHFLENILEMTGYRLTQQNQLDDYGQEKIWKTYKQTPRKKKSQIASIVENALKVADFKEYSLETQESLACWNPDIIGFNLIENLLCYICERESPGAVLVFMTGWDDISSLKDKLHAHPILGDPCRVLLLPCHGSMGSLEQKLIFDEPEYGVRKIVLATNIAESSITINDVVFVVDCGKAKETSYDALNNTPCLLPSWISKVSSIQRRGRAGRVQPGKCYHLYPKCVYEAFTEYQIPEILRTPLQSLCLQIKSLKLGSISEFLSQALQSPDSMTVQNAVNYLKTIGALDVNENLTCLGHYLTMLPMDPKLGKMLIFGAIFCCLDPILTVVAGLSVRDPFLTPFDKKDLADAAKVQFSNDFSDHLALVRAYEGWKNAEIDVKGYQYCWKNFISVQSMKTIGDLREEFFSLLKDIGFVDHRTTTCNAWSHDVHLIRSIICSGLYPRISSVVPNEKSFSLKTMEDGQVHLHSNSVNARHSKLPYSWLVFNEKIKVKSIFLRDSTALSDSALLLFGGTLSRGDSDGHIKMLGGYLEFFMKPGIAEMFLKLRTELEELIQNKLLNPRLALQGYYELMSAVRMLVSDNSGDGRFVFRHQTIKPPSSDDYSGLMTGLTTTPAAVSKSESGPGAVSRSESGPGGDNAKSELQTLLARAGEAAPLYKSTQMKDLSFRSVVEFNGMAFAGQACKTKRCAEKDAASEALQWLFARGGDCVDSLLKKCKT